MALIIDDGIVVLEAFLCGGVCRAAVGYGVGR